MREFSREPVLSERHSFVGTGGQTKGSPVVVVLWTEQGHSLDTTSSNVAVDKVVTSHALAPLDVQLFDHVCTLP